MKHCPWLLLLLLIGSLFADAQTCLDQDDPYAERAIQSALSLNGVSLSFTEKAINRLGDRAALGLMRAMSNQPLTTPDQVRGVLSIIRNSFAAPRVIALDADRKPKATLFLLKYLQVLPISRSLTAEVSKTKAFIVQSTKSD